MQGSLGEYLESSSKNSNLSLSCECWEVLQEFFGENPSTFLRILTQVDCEDMFKAINLVTE